MGARPTTGFTGLSPTFDAPGLLAARVSDLVVTVDAVDGTHAEDPAAVRAPVWTGTELANIDPAMHEAVRRTVHALAADGAGTDQLGDDVGTPGLTEAHATVMAFEAARSLRAEAQHPESLSRYLNELLERGRNTPEDT